jgi:hypothetical protein
VKGVVSDVGGKVVAYRRQNCVRQLKDTWPVEPTGPIYRALAHPIASVL